MLPAPVDDDANNFVVSCASSVASSSTSKTIASICTTTELLTNKPPRSPTNSDRKSYMPITTTTTSLPPTRARAQSTDSGTTIEQSTTTNKTTVNTPPPPPPPLRHRCFSTDSSLTTTSVVSTSSCYNSPPPLPPARRRAYSSDSDGRSMSSNVSSSSRSLQGRRRLDRQESKNNRPSGGSSSSSSSGSPQSTKSTTERRASGSNASPSANNSGAASTTLDLHTLEAELQKNKLLYGKQDVSVGKLWNAIGNSQFRHGNHRAAIQAYKQAGSCDPGPHTATAHLNLGTVYWNLLKVDKSIKYLQQALVAFDELSSAASLDAASCHHQLGLAYSLQHRFDEALRAMETACRMRAALLGTNDPTTARTLDALGKVHLMRGDMPRALTCHEQALYALRLARFPATSTLENIAAVHMRRGDFAAAIHIYVQVVDIHKSTWQHQNDSLESNRSSSSSTAEQYYESLHQLAMSYDHVGETQYADHCRREAAEVLNAGKIERSSSF
jgi:tetratricopeptide (TPR) repeat protein